MKIHEYAAQGRIRSIEKEIAKGVNIDSKDAIIDVTNYIAYSFGTL